MPGNMPFHLEKGALGLRMDFLIKVPAVRSEVLSRLMAGDDLWTIAAAITVGSVTVNLFADPQADFVAKLDQLTPGGTEGNEYLEKQALLRPLNQDSTGNRTSFAQFWQNALSQNPGLPDQLRQELILALDSGREVDFWWECSLPTPSSPQVKTSLDLPEIARVMFRTDHRTIVPDEPGQQPRPPIDSVTQS
jgi:hypothetical protein